MSKKGKLGTAWKALRTQALEFPGAWEDHPWGENVVKVGKKVFVFLGMEDDPRLTISAKLPHTAEEALRFSFAAPTGYGLGRAGWVTAAFDPGDAPPVDLLLEWVDESYRAVAPKKLLAELDAHLPGEDHAS